MSQHTTLYNFAFNEDYKQVDKILTEQKGDPNMAIMGFSNKQLKILNGAILPDDVKEMFKTLSDEDKKKVKELEKQIWWCFEHGACLIFGIQYLR
jgi:CRISPR/Cas system-associated endonuclease Cas3-HD